MATYWLKKDLIDFPGAKSEKRYTTHGCPHIDAPEGEFEKLKEGTDFVRVDTPPKKAK